MTDIPFANMFEALYLGCYAAGGRTKNFAILTDDTSRGVEWDVLDMMGEVVGRVHINEDEDGVGREYIVVEQEGFLLHGTWLDLQARLT